MSDKIKDIEKKIYELTSELRSLRKNVEPVEVKNYELETRTGKVRLLDLFGGRDKLLVIHNMGQACRYCTLWADGINAFLPHLESAMAVVLVSKDAPALQQQFADSRQWRFRLASHGGGEYIQDQNVCEGKGNWPGAVAYETRDGKIYRKSSCEFGPGDLYCSHWHLLGLFGMGDEDWTPQYRYWQPPKKMDDGGANLQN